MFKVFDIGKERNASACENEILFSKKQEFLLKNTEIFYYTNLSISLYYNAKTCPSYRHSDGGNQLPFLFPNLLT